MLVHISAPLFDPAGVISLDIDEKESNFGDSSRRVTRIATLDGGAVFNDFGFSHSDKTVTLVHAVKTKAEALSVEQLVSVYSLLNVSLPNGFYSVAPESYVLTQETGTLTLLVKSKLSGE